MTRSVTGIALATLALAAALAAALPGASSADHQTAKNGCTSLAPQSGSLTSGALPSPQTTDELRFRTWWETQSLDPLNRDRLHVQTNVNGNGFQTVLTLNEPYPSGAPVPAAPDVPLSNLGPQQKPAFGSFVTLPVNAFSLQVRFVFESVDPLHNGFRGWGIDQFELLQSGTPTFLEGFEAGFGIFTPDGQWTRVSNSALPAILSPAINPNLITLGAGDDGRLPPAAEGSSYAWFGQAATGTYCGAGADHPLPNVAPTAAFNVSPPITQTGDAVGFDGSPSSDPEGALASHTWDFGDGSPTATGPAVNHTYTKKGTYTVRLTVADAQGATSTASYSMEVRSNLPSGIPVADTLDELPNPRPFTNVNIEPTEGEVFVQIPGRGARAAQVPGAPRGFIPLTQAARLPIRAVIDTSQGKVMLESALDRRGRRAQRAEFFDGRFSMRQRRAARPTTEILLKGGSRRGCPATPRPRSSGAPEAGDSQRSRRRSRRSRVRRLWGNGRGRYRTRGRYSAATVRGTQWLVEDRCGETLTRVARRPRTSVVDVRDFGRRRTVRLRAGRRYAALPSSPRR
ncbi:MAG: PKD domain-containing protein [Thermoleophilaceae bacterium]